MKDNATGVEVDRFEFVYDGAPRAGGFLLTEVRRKRSLLPDGHSLPGGAKRMYGPPVFDAQTESGTPAPEEQEDVDPSPDETQEPVE